MIEKRENLLQIEIKKQPNEKVENIKVKKTIKAVPVKKTNETDKAPVKTPVKKVSEIKSYKIIGTCKKKTLWFTKISKSVLDAGCELYDNQKITEVIESAIIESVKKDEKIYKALISKLKDEGGKIQ